MCIGCRNMKPKKDLVRIVRNKDGAVEIDLKGKSPGRGAYLCPDRECLARALKAKRIEKEFGAANMQDIAAGLEELFRACTPPDQKNEQADKGVNKQEI